MSLRRRLSITMTALIAAGCIIFGVVSLAVIDGALRANIDAKLATVARAASDVVDVDKSGKPSVDSDDLAQMHALHDADEHIAVLDHRGKLIFGDAVPEGAGARNVRSARTDVLHGRAGVGTIVAWRDGRFVVQVHNAAALAFVCVGLAIVAVAFIFSGWYAGTILGPVERVAQLAEQIESRDLSQRLHAGGDDELGRLCASFDRMLERLEASFDSERRFVADASHELRTPLAVVRAETDLALRRPRSTEEYVAALSSIDRETHRLEALVDQLLDTMRDRSVGGFERVDLGALAHRISERLQPASTRLELHVDGCADIFGSAHALERAVLAIVHNAITHGDGSVAIDVRAEGAWVELSVADGGPGFTDEALAHATERFWRADSARSRGGTGLGLSIANVLAQAHGGSLALKNGARGGAVVTLLLPRAREPMATTN